MTSELADRLKQLQAAFPLEVVGFKPQTVNGAKTSALIATFIDARAVVNRLDEVFPLAWEDTYVPVENDAKLLTLECSITVHLADGRAITRRDVGESGNTGGQASRWKSATSDAFKRAAVKFGVGAYLYGLENTWVEVKEVGRSVKITEKGLRAAEASYVAAVKALGLTTTGERSQGQLAEPEAAVEAKPQAEAEPKLSKARAEAMHREVGKLGVAKQYDFAAQIVGREIDSFTELSETEAKKVWSAAQRQAQAS